MTRTLTRLLAVFCLIGLTACQNTNNALPPLPELSFKRYQPIYLDVANIDVVEEYKSPMKEPYVEHLLPMSPTEGTYAWVRDRLRPIGINRQMQVIIKDASVKSTALPKTKGVEGAFTNDQDRRYDARLELELRVYGENGAMSEASIQIVATQSNTLSEKATVDERKRFFMRTLSQLMETANSELEKQIFKYFSRYINYSRTS